MTALRLPVLAAALMMLLFPLPAAAQGISGYAEAKGFGFAEPSPGGEPRALGWGTLLVKREDRIGEARMAGSLRAEWISSDGQGKLGFDPADRDIRRPPVSLPELWVRLPLAPSLDLQIGRFQLGWGKTDGYSPADAFLPRDLTDPFSDEKIPLWAARLNGEKGALRFEAVASPVTTPWRLPALDGRYAPLAMKDVPDGIVFREVDSDPPVPGFAALRLLAALGQWDLGAWGRFGVRPAPLLAFRFDRAVPTSEGFAVPVERRYARERGVGVELSRIAGSWVLRGEAAALFSGDPDLGDAVIGSLSAERGFGDGTLLVTLAGNAKEPPADPRLLFDRGVLPALIAAWNRTEEWGGWKLVWSAGLKRGDGLVKGELGYNLTDFRKLTVGCEVPYGAKEGPFGSLHAARRAHLAIRQSW